MIKMSKLTPDTQEELSVAISYVEPWKQIETDIQGVRIIRTPEYNDQFKVFVEISSNEHKGIYIKSLEQFYYLRELFNDERVFHLIDFINDKYNNNTEPIELKMEN